jgi:hypothetical protein
MTSIRSFHHVPNSKVSSLLQHPSS